ncbi:cysteine-rich receptor-like protein kinase 10 isoform X1 [Arachis stenosperma]|uniref:cysteine-rich receptor-like protein kinase 10 isoform X1 n=1 Tax=Arachis stenosperma TaxID=217475 RepID=UPI0025AB97DD|nr:cysteine-rich receptor-like protein kinase 10 isoform X1 [Arachis stenosperma]
MALCFVVLLRSLAVADKRVSTWEKAERKTKKIHSPMIPKYIELVILVSSLCLVSQVCYADPPFEICSSHENGSTFQNNLNNLLQSLPSNASASKFYNTSYGNTTERVYGLYMCLDFISSKGCQNCIATAIEDILKLCPQSQEAVLWEESCQIRYSNTNFIGTLNDTGNIGKDNVQNVSEPHKFQSSVDQMLSNLSATAAFNVSANMYATGEAPFGDETIYALVQCTRDLSSNDCSKCLKSAMRDIPSCCYGSIGARVLSRSCYLRYEFYPFYLGATGPLSPSPHTNQGKNSSRSSKVWIITGIAVALVLCLTIIFIYCMYFTRNKKTHKRDEAVFHHPDFPRLHGVISEDSPYIDFGSLCVATKNFSDSNKLGQGGFGPVYKGILSNEQEVAIKRLSTCSEQGSEEFINEVLLIMKLQHKNLVKLLGFCVDGEEKLLVYEYLPNGSLDVLLFDPNQRATLVWTKRLDIIEGLAKGILYLHEDSRLKIIHRDLKASNVLLDSDMNPKISDFGMAKIFAGNEGEANTATIVGTYGYMAPEYAMEGLYSIKSDVFAYGVLVLEIITGKHNAGFFHSKSTPSLLTYAWHLWNEGKGLELKDPLLGDSCQEDEFLRCMNIGLLCVQEDAYDRPSMSSVVLMLKNESAMVGQPARPPFSVGKFNDNDGLHPHSKQCSITFLTDSDILLPRD